MPLSRRSTSEMGFIERTGVAPCILLVEDNSGDVRLTLEAFKEVNPSIQIYVVSDGVEAMEFLRNEGVHIRAPRPDLILLDLNIPKMGGDEVLEQIKNDEGLSNIPTVVLTVSEAQADIENGYRLRANCYLVKPVLLEDFET